MTALADTCLAAGLSAREAEAVLARYEDGATVAETARRMGTTEGAAIRARQRGERRLREWLTSQRRQQAFEKLCDEAIYAYRGGEVAKG